MRLVQLAIIVFVKMESALFTGGRLRSSPVGGSEAKATETTESRMRFSHCKRNTVRGNRTSMQAQIIFSTKIDAPIASWNC